MGTWNNLNGFGKHSIWHVRSSLSSPPPVCPLKQAVYLFPVSQHPFFPHCYSSPCHLPRLPPSAVNLLPYCLLCLLLSTAPPPPPQQPPPPDGCFCQWDSPDECRQTTIHRAVMDPNMYITHLSEKPQGSRLFVFRHIKVCTHGQRCFVLIFVFVFLNG